MKSVAFIGLGAIGAPMARCIAMRGFSLAVWNRTPEKAVTFARTTAARVARSPADVVRGADVVITCLPSSREVESLLDGGDGVLVELKKDAILVDCTSGDPATSRRVAQRLDGRNGFVDAPVSGGTSRAEKGTLTVMCGGSVQAVEAVRPVLAAFGEKIVHCGGVGAGHTVKAVNQALLAVHIWSLAEGLALLTKAGVSPARALEVINASSGRSNTSENLFPQRVLTRDFPRTFRLALLDKDVAIAADVAREYDIPSPLLDLTADLIRGAHRQLGEDADHVEVVRVVERSAGVEIA